MTDEIAVGLCMGEAHRWVIADESSASTTPHNHISVSRKSPQYTRLRGSYGAHGYGCLFCESSLIPSGQVIVVQCEGVTVVPRHYHKSTGNSISCPYREMLHGWLHATSKEKINKQIHKGNNKTSLFHIINLARVLSPPQKQRNLLTQRGQKHHHNKEMNE
jgi:hypothetical protein